MNQMDAMIEEASKEGKYFEPCMRCMTTSTHHLKAYVITILGKIGTQRVNFLIDSGSTHCFLFSSLFALTQLSEHFVQFVIRDLKLFFLSLEILLDCL